MLVFIFILYSVLIINNGINYIQIKAFGMLLYLLIGLQSPTPK